MNFTDWKESMATKEVLKPWGVMEITPGALGGERVVLNETLRFHVPPGRHSLEMPDYLVKSWENPGDLVVTYRHRNFGVYGGLTPKDCRVTGPVSPHIPEDLVAFDTTSISIEVYNPEETPGILDFEILAFFERSGPDPDHSKCLAFPLYFTPPGSIEAFKAWARGSIGMFMDY